MIREAVAALVFRRTGSRYEVLALRRATEPFLGEWFPVEGTMDPGESPQAAVLRELREETGLEATDFRHESSRRVPTRDSEILIHIFASFVEIDSVVRLNEEHCDHRWCSIEEAKSLFPLEAQRAALRRIEDQLINLR